MKPIKLISTAALLALAGAAVLAADMSDKNAAKLAQMLEGRAPGEPVSCIPTFMSDRLQVIEGVALVYDSGDTLYVARPKEPKSLGRNDIVVINRFGGQLCYTDVIKTIDRNGGYLTGVLFLEKWVPYRKKD